MWSGAEAAPHQLPEYVKWAGVRGVVCGIAEAPHW